MMKERKFFPGNFFSQSIFRDAISEEENIHAIF